MRIRNMLHSVVKRLAGSFRNQLFPEMATVPGAIGNIRFQLSTS